MMIEWSEENERALTELSKVTKEFYGDTGENLVDPRMAPQGFGPGSDVMSMEGEGL